MNTDGEVSSRDDGDTTGHGIDPLLVAACRLGGQGFGDALPDLPQAEQQLTAADRHALESIWPNLGSRIVARGERSPGKEADRVSTTLGPDTATIAPAGSRASPSCRELLKKYDAILMDKSVTWTSEYKLARRLGAGGQGVVYLTERRGFDDFAFPVALKVFSPQRYREVRHYEEAMQRIADVSSLVAQIHHESLLDVHSFVHRDRIRMTIMEWIDGYDLRRLLGSNLLAGVRSRVSNRRWEYINRVIVTEGPEQSRMKAGVAVGIIRDCLSALAALHREEIVHGDIKPSNIMLKRTGHAKIIDMGSAFEWNNPPLQRSFTLAYAPPEVLERRVCTPQSDLASLGYVLVELLSGRAIFSGSKSDQELLEVKRSLPRRLKEILPEEVTKSDVLTTFCQRLIAPDPNYRFPSAEEADLHSNEGASAFHYQLVRGNLASVFDNDLRLWVEAVKEWDEASKVG